MSFKETEVGRIPQEWQVKMIQEIGEVISGGTPKTKELSYWDGNISWITPKDLSNFNERYIEFGERSITDEGLNNSSAKLLPKGTVLFSSRAPIGYVAIAKKDLCTNQGFKNIVCDEKLSNNEFIYYMMKYKKNEIESIAGGSTFKEVSGKVIKEFKLPIPSIEEQKAIAKILSDLDNKIEVNNKINKRLEEMAQAIFKHWFVDFEFPNEEGKPYKSSGGEMVESEFGMIPKGWEVIRFGDAVEKIIDNRGKTPKTESKGYRLVEGFSINMGYSFIDKESEKQKYVNEETYNTWFRSGHPQYLDILCATVGTLPKWCFANKNEKICIAQNIIGIRANKEISSPYYLKLYMDTREFIGSFNGRIVTTAQPSIKVGHMEDIKILIPEKSIINKLDSAVKNIYNKIENNNYQIYKITNIRDTLLPKLMSGEIRVPLD